MCHLQSIRETPDEEGVERNCRKWFEMEGHTLRDKGTDPFDVNCMLSCEP